MKLLRKLISFILYTALSAAVIAAISLRELIVGPVRLKAVAIFLYAAYILSFIYNGKLFFILVMLYVVISMIISVMLMKQQPEGEPGVGVINQCRNIFTGMTEDEAKREYRKLMKEYHPDNAATGNAKKAVEIQREYENYRNGL